MNQSKVRELRTCRKCLGQFRFTGNELREHSRKCDGSQQLDKLERRYLAAGFGKETAPQTCSAGTPLLAQARQMIQERMKEVT